MTVTTSSVPLNSCRLVTGTASIVPAGDPPRTLTTDVATITSRTPFDVMSTTHVFMRRARTGGGRGIPHVRSAGLLARPSWPITARILRLSSTIENRRR